MVPTSQAAHSVRSVLFANAIFSLLSGSVLVLAAAPLSRLITPAHPEWFGWPAWTALTAVGAGVLLFALNVLLVARRDPPPRKLIWAICGADVGWVVGSAVLLVAAESALGGAGVALVAGAAAIVAGFAWLEYKAVGALA